MGTLLRTPEGNTVEVPDEQVGHALDVGFKRESAESAGENLTKRDTSDSEGVLGSLSAGVSSTLSGATLGLSDAFLAGIGTNGTTQAIADAREAHPIISGVGQVAGMLASGRAAPGSLLGDAPAGMLSRFTGEAIDAAKASGTLPGLAGQVLFSGGEAAIQNGGMYLSDVALGDRDLTAEGMIGALGHGFEFGTVAGGATYGIERGTMAARRMFARTAEGGEAAAKSAQGAWERGSEDALAANEQTASVARSRLKEISLAKQEAGLARAQAQADIAKEKLAAFRESRAPSSEPVASAAPPLGEAPVGSPEAPSTDSEIGVSADATELQVQPNGSGAAPTTSDDLLDRLKGTKAQIDSGTALRDVRPGGAPKEAPLGDDEFKQLLGATTATFSPEARKAMEGYSQNGSFGPLNNALRSNLKRDIEQRADRIAGMDAAIASSRAPRELTVYRGVNGQAREMEGKIDLAHLRPGETFTDKGYGSASASPQIGHEYSVGLGMRQGVELRITIPEGHPIAPVPSPDFSREREMLLPRNTKMTVTHVEKAPDGRTIVHVTAGDAAASGSREVSAREVAKRSPDYEPPRLSDARVERPDGSIEQAEESGADVTAHTRFPAAANSKSATIEAARAADAEYAAAVARASRSSGPERAAALDDAVAAEAKGRDIVEYQGRANSDTLRHIDRARDAEGVTARDVAEKRADDIAAGRYKTLGRPNLPSAPTAALIGPEIAATEEKLTTALKNYEQRKSAVDEWVARIRNPRISRDMEIGPSGNAITRGRSSMALPEDVMVEQSGGQIRTIGRMEGAVGDVTANSRVLARSNGPDFHAGSVLDEAYQDAIERASLAETPELRDAALRDAADAEKRGHDFVRGHKPENTAVLDAIEAKRAEAGTTAYESAAKRASKLAERGVEAERNGPYRLKAQDPADRAYDEMLRRTQPDLYDRAPNVVEDAHAAAEVLGPYEQASAELAEAVGPATPPAAQEAASGYRKAESDATEKQVARTARATDDHANGARHPVRDSKATAPSGAPLAVHRERLAAIRVEQAESDLAARKAMNEARVAKARGGPAPKAAPLTKQVEPAVEASPLRKGLMEKAKGIGTAIEVAHDLGIPGVPSPADIPVIGPLLSLYLKGRALKAAVGRMTGRVAATGEARAAALAAKTKDRAAIAVDRMLGLAERSMPLARSVTVATARPIADALRVRLFDDGSEPPPKDAPAPVLAAARARELAAAVANPQAAVDGVRRQLASISDPTLIAAAEQAHLRRLQYLHDQAPKEPPPSPLSKVRWTPSPSETAIFANRCAAAANPGEVLEQLSAGTITREGAETLRACYPKLFGQVQQRLMDRAAELKTDVPYAQRIKMSVLFDAPLDPSMNPATIASLQTAHATSSPAAPTQTQPPTPSIAGHVDLTALYQTPSDRRAARR